MIRVERKCNKCEGRWWLGDFDQKYDIFYAYIPRGQCTFCGNRWEFSIVLTVLKEEKAKDDLPI